MPVVSKQDYENWDEPILKRWLGTITRNETLRQNKTAFRCYHQYTNMTATELIKEALEDAIKDPLEKRGIVLQKLIGFYKWLSEEYPVRSRGKGEHIVLRKGVSPKLARMRVNVVRSFYGTFDIVVRMKGRTLFPKQGLETNG